MHGRMVVTLVAALSLATAADAAAQLCAGFPTSAGQGSIEAQVQFPDGGTGYGVRASYHATGVGVFGGVDLLDPDLDGADSQEIFTVGAAVGMPSTSAPLSYCGVAQLSYADVEGISLLQVPVGLGLATRSALSPTSDIGVYAIPALYYTRVELNGASDDSYDPGVAGGVVVTFDRFFVGGRVEHVFADDSDPVFGIRAGIRI